MATERPVSGWAIGWTTFAATMLMIVGVFQAIVGLAAVLEDEVLVLAEEYVFKFDLTTWGWVHLGLALVLFLTGLGLLRAAMWARVIGVIVAGLSMIVNFAYLPWYPVWSIVMIIANIFVIWALTVHGRDVAVETEPLNTADGSRARHSVG